MIEDVEDDVDELPDSDFAKSATKIFDIKATEYKTNISTPMLSGSGKNVLSFGSLSASASPKIIGGGFGG